MAGFVHGIHISLNSGRPKSVHGLPITSGHPPIPIRETLIIGLPGGTLLPEKNLCQASVLDSIPLPQMSIVPQSINTRQASPAHASREGMPSPVPPSKRGVPAGAPA